MSKSNLPSFLNPADKKGDQSVRQNVLNAVKNDAKNFKLNHIIVFDETLSKIDKCLTKHAHGIEYVKMHSGDFESRTKDMKRFVSMCNDHDVVPYVGGGATETAIREGGMFSYTQNLHTLGINTIEISNSDGDLPASRCGTHMRSIRKDFERVLVEIGSKSRSKHRTQDEWKRDLDAAMEADATAVILEGMAGGNAGIYDEDGDENSLLVIQLMEQAGDRADRILIEAPRTSQREFWINEFAGWNIRLGNIPLRDESLKETDNLRIDATNPNKMKEIEQRKAKHISFKNTVIQICAEEKFNSDQIVFYPSMQGTTIERLEDNPGWEERLRDFIRQDEKDDRSKEDEEPTFIRMLRAMGVTVHRF